MSYFADNPKIVKVFNDLERFRDFCRFEWMPFDEKNLYNNASREWRAFNKRNNNHYKKRGNKNFNNGKHFNKRK